MCVVTQYSIVHDKARFSFVKSLNPQLPALFGRLVGAGALAEGPVTSAIRSAASPFRSDSRNRAEARDAHSRG